MRACAFELVFVNADQHVLRPFANHYPGRLAPDLMFDLFHQLMESTDESWSPSHSSPATLGVGQSLSIHSLVTKIGCRLPAALKPWLAQFIPTKPGHTAIRKVREPTDNLDNLAHGGLGGGSDKVLRASGCAWARGRREGQLVEYPTVRTRLLLLLGPTIEREAEMRIKLPRWW